MAVIKDENIYQPPCLFLFVYNSIFFFPRSYQLAEDLGRAFADRAILQTFIEAENSVTVASLKGCVWLRTHLTTSTWSSLTLLLLLLAFRNRIKDMYNHIRERSRLKAPLIADDVYEIIMKRDGSGRKMEEVLVPNY
ncbi:hypothetical protein ACS0TY_026941 [Phlomoides rotata]